MSQPSGTAAVVIPARLESRRFPRKVLARETGKYLVQHVWEAVQGCPGISRVIVATDGEEVVRAVRSFGGEARMTSSDHVSGTDRVAEVARELSEEFIINVQGDEPQISHNDLRQLLELFRDDTGDSRSTVMTTLAVRRRDPEGFRDANIVKAVIAADRRALYFSRSPVPHPPRDAASTETLEWWQHLGVYAYRSDFLQRYTRLEPTALEQRERLEQLRALEHGYVIRVGETEGSYLGIDTEEEYRSFVAEYLRGNPVSMSSEENKSTV